MLYRLAPNTLKERILTVRGPNGEQRKITGHIQSSPRLVQLSNTEQIGNVINAKAPNPLERRLLEVAYSEGFEAKFSSARPANLSALIRKGAEKVSEHLRHILPPGETFEVALEPLPRLSANDNPLQLTVSLKDSFSGDAFVHRRGAGVRKMLSLSLLLADAVNDRDQILMTIDEPENSLHANSQHGLRMYLEALAEASNIQVIYATHSPSMINPIRCEAIRLLQRKTENGRATSLWSLARIDRISQ